MLRIAFGDRPNASIRLPQPGVPELGWLAAVGLGARGRYAAAAALLDPLTRDPRASRVVRAHAAVTRAAHLRQAGGHLPARRWDALGLALATPVGHGDPCLDRNPRLRRFAVDRGMRAGMRAEVGVGIPATGSAGAGLGDTGIENGATRGAADPGGGRATGLAYPGRGVHDPGLDRAAARVDALLGLAADAIGLAQIELAGRLLAAARPVAVQHPSWRPRVRWCWVGAELALAQDRPAQAADLAARALRDAGRAGSVRHEIKSALVLAVAEVSAGRDRRRLIEKLGELSERTRHYGLTTLEWPVRLQLATLTEATDPVRATTHHREAVRIVGNIRRFADPFVRYVLDHSLWVPRLSEALLV